MKIEIINGFRNPNDPSGKSRFAAVLAREGGKMLVAPCTTYPARTGRVPYGSALITEKSKAYKGSGFTSEQVAISIRDVAVYSESSEYLVDSVKTGSITPSKDKRFESNFKDVLGEVDISNLEVYD